MGLWVWLSEEPRIYADIRHREQLSSTADVLRTLAMQVLAQSVFNESLSSRSDGVGPGYHPLRCVIDGCRWQSSDNLKWRSNVLSGVLAGYQIGRFTFFVGLRPFFCVSAACLPVACCSAAVLHYLYHTKMLEQQYHYILVILIFQCSLSSVSVFTSVAPVSRETGIIMYTVFVYTFSPHRKTTRDFVAV